ncbi:hypothetical protein [Halosimplex salinum]|uniref:hypothetical protein n=1 Tax=Halosimplex salinum TaxID=1710538 RepID=UPI0019D127ED|nr:hypothetical protein [Halosimplex salinum]
MTAETRQRDAGSRTDERTNRADEATETVGRLRRGLEGGALATFVMTAHRLPVTRSLPPTAEFWSMVVGGTPRDHPVAALVLHFAYGIAAGGVFAALFPRRSSVHVDEAEYGTPDRSREVSTTVAGLLYGAVLSVVGEYVVLGALLRTDPDDRFVFHVGHVLYGITLGAWVGTRTRPET